jgi:hypothetical protein
MLLSHYKVRIALYDVLNLATELLNLGYSDLTIIIKIYDKN